MYHPPFAGYPAMSVDMSDFGLPYMSSTYNHRNYLNDPMCYTLKSSMITDNTILLNALAYLDKKHTQWQHYLVYIARLNNYIFNSCIETMSPKKYTLKGRCLMSYVVSPKAGVLDISLPVPGMVTYPLLDSQKTYIAQ